MAKIIAMPTPIPVDGSLARLREAAMSCRNCPLWKNATRTVFGEGPADASLVIVGEQPGDREDQAGRPFVGPAGRLLDRALAEAGIDRERAWLTNAVKHFKWKPRGKIRLHQKPSVGEVNACRPWLAGELDRIAPEVLIILGATAARSLLGSGVRVTVDRGLVARPDLAPRVILTIHPSALLRSRDRRGADQAFHDFVRDLAMANIDAS